MSTGPRLALPMLLVLAACGGGGGGGGGGVSVNSFTGTVNVAAGTVGAGCAVTHTVTFSGGSGVAGGATPQTVSAAVGDCITFTVSDGTAHEVVAREPTGCDELTVGAIGAATPSRTTVPLAAQKVCHWADAINPPPAPGGGAGEPGY